MALLEALYTQGELRLEYDARRTRTAAEAFDARMGNCLSLVIMTAAFATEMQLQVRFQDVLGIVFDSWDERLGVKLDRELVCELIIRYVLSEQLVPASPEQRRNMPRRIERLVSALVTGKTARR